MLERVRGVLLRTSASDMDIYNKEPFHDFFQRIYNNSISLINMGSYTSKLQRVFSDEVPEGERFYGLENYRFTCYCNSIIQALYFCIPFRTQLLEYHSKIRSTGKPKENMLTCLADLFIEIGSKKTRTGVIAPKKFIRRVRDESEHFSNFMQQDAHEFLNYLLNKLVDILEKDAKDKANSSRVQETEMRNGCPDNGISKSSTETKSDSEFSSLVHDIFQGVLTNETRCLCCETVTARDEKFLDLSLDIEENSSITSCLRKFSAVETLHSEDKFFCDKCCSLQEAQKRMKIKVLPQVLVIHLKRFKYIEEMNQFRKLCYRIAFPLELKLFNTVEDASDSETEYSLSAVVVHVGRSADRGHYITLVKSANRWVSFDDENVQIIDESVVQQCFGFARESVYNTDHGYILFYEKTIEQSPDVPDIA